MPQAAAPEAAPAVKVTRVAYVPAAAPVRAPAAATTSGASARARRADHGPRSPAQRHNPAHTASKPFPAQPVPWLETVATPAARELRRVPARVALAVAALLVVSCAFVAAAAREVAR
jgi:hypothetical protein